MCMPLFKRNIRTGIKLMIIFVAILAMYTSVIIYMYNDDLAKLLNQYKDMMPEMMSAMGMGGTVTSLIEFINTYLNGFLMLVVPMVFTMLLVNSYVMKYEDNGSMSCLLATPNSRRKIIVTQVFSVILMITVLIVIITIIGIFSSEMMFSGKLDIGKYIFMNLCTLFMHYLIAGICFMTACFVNETKWYLAFGVGLPLTFFIIQMMANMGGDLKIFKYFTIYTLLPYDEIIHNGSGIISSICIILAVVIFTFTLGVEKFVRKDLHI